MRATGRCWSRSTKFQFRKMSKFWSSNVEPRDYAEQYCTVQLTSAEICRVVLSILTMKKDNGNYVR